MAVGAAYFGGQALNALGTGNNISSSESSNAGLGIGVSSGKSWSEGGGSSYEYGESNSVADNFSDEWSRTYGSEASAKDIERANEANEKAYELWKAQADFNASEAEKQRKWQEELSNSAYQRTVKDLLAAGLNPYLAATSLGGAATPSGAIATSGLATAHKATTYPDSESQGHSQGHSESSSWNEGGGSNYSLGGSNNYGINFEINSGKSSSNSEPALGNIISTAVKNATASASGKSTSNSTSKSGMTIGQWQASVRSGGSSSSSSAGKATFKGFDGSGYDPAY